MRTPRYAGTQSITSHLTNYNRTDFCLIIHQPYSMIPSLPFRSITFPFWSFFFERRFLNFFFKKKKNPFSGFKLIKFLFSKVHLAILSFLPSYYDCITRFSNFFNQSWTICESQSFFKSNKMEIAVVSTSSLLNPLKAPVAIFKLFYFFFF